MANRTRRFGDQLNNHTLEHNQTIQNGSHQPLKNAFTIPACHTLEDQENRLHPVSNKDGSKFQVYCDENEAPNKLGSSECQEKMLVDNMEAYKKHLDSILIDSSETEVYQLSSQENEDPESEAMVVENNNSIVFADQSSILNDSSACERSETSIIQTSIEPNVFYDYAHSIGLYMLERERVFLADPCYMEDQININAKMRSILIDWMVDVVEEYKMHDETFFLAINYIDRFLSKASITRQEFQLLGASALFLSSKYEEIYPPSLRDFVEVTDEYYTKAEILKSERLLLTVLEFNISPPTCNYFLEKILYDLDISKEAYCLAKYLCFLTSLECTPFLQYYPSELALASVSVASECLGLTNVMSDEYLKQSLEYEHSLGNTGDVSRMLYNRNVLHGELESLLRMAKSHPQQAIQRKFATSKYCYVSNLEF